SFVTSMLNPISDAGVESIFTTASSSVAPLPTPIPTMTPSIITTITTASHPPIPPTLIPSEVLQNLPTFDSVFRFNERLKSLEASFSEYRQTNPFVEAVSNIPDIVHKYMNQQMHEVVRVAVQIQTDRLHDSYQRENDEFLKTIDDNMKRIIKEKVKSQIKDQVSRILPRIEQSVNAQLKSEVLTRSSHLSRTSYAVAADLSEMELKKILIEKMEGNKSIQREDDDDQEGPSTGLDRGSKRRREGREPESASTPSEPATRSTSRSTTGTQSRQMLASEFAFVEEPVQTTCQMDKPSHLVFETVAADLSEMELKKILIEKMEENKDDDDDDDDEEEEIAKINETEDTESGGDSKDDGNGKEDQGFRISEEERIHEEKEADELYRDVNINQGRGLQVFQDIKDSHVTLTSVQPDGQQESSSVSSFVTSMLNSISDVGVESIFTTASSLVAPLPTHIPTMTPSIITTITTASHPSIPPTPISSEVLQNLPAFDSVFNFNERLKSLEASFSEYRQTNPFVEVVSNIPDKTILESYGDTAILKRRCEDDDDQEGPSAGSDRGSKRREKRTRRTADVSAPSEKLPKGRACHSLSAPTLYIFGLRHLPEDTRGSLLMKLPPDDIQALSCCYMTPLQFIGSSAKADSLADACRDLDLIVDMPALLVAGSNGVRADSGSPPSLHLLDPRSDPAEASANGFVCLYSEKLASNDFNLLLKQNTELNVGRFCRTSLGIGVGGIGGWLAIVMNNV
nr:hypothetical protein [Tanacetum cinerariifolium]